MPSRPPNWRVAAARFAGAGVTCTKVGKLGDRCLEPRFHGGNHRFPPNPRKRPGQPITG